MNRRRAIILGIVVSICIVVGLIGSIWLSQIPVFGGQTHIDILVTNAAQIEKGERVYFMGVDVGRVTQVGFGRSDQGPSAVVQIAVPKDIQIPIDSRVLLVSGLMERSINIFPGTNTTFVGHEGTIVGKTLDLTESYFQTITVLDSLFKPANMEAYSRAVQGAATALSQLNVTMAENRGYVQGFLKNTDDLMQKLNGVLGSQRMERIVTQGDSLVQNLSRLADRMDQGQGTIGRLMTQDDIYRQMEQFTQNLNRVAKSSEVLINKTDTLVTEFRKNPGKFINLKIF